MTIPAAIVFAAVIAGTVVVRDDLSLELLHWDRYVWRTTPWYLHTPSVGAAVARIEGLPRVEPRRPDGGERVALDGGAIDVNGRGMLLATEQHLLSQSRAHNAGFSREDYEQLIRRELGVSHTIWLGEGCLGDATNGHVDNVALCIRPGVVLAQTTADPDDVNHDRLRTNVDVLENKLIELLPESAPIYAEDQVTDRSERFLAAEFIREKLMRSLGQEIPYALTVEIEQFKMDGALRRVAAVIFVEREGQKRIVIGKAGQGLKEVGRQAREQMERTFGSKVFLELWVKVRAGWSDDERALRSLGYTDE